LSTDFSNVCFVISPIGAEGSPERQQADQMLKYVVKPVLEGRDLFVQRADMINDPGTISTQIIEYLMKVPVVIADMTGHNPNVFYELAVRHAARRPVVHMIQTGETLPFDVAPQRAIMYTLDLEGVDKAKQQLADMLTAIASSPDNEPDSPLTNALERLTIGPRSNDSSNRENQLLELVQDIHVRLVNSQSMNARSILSEGRFEEMHTAVLRLVAEILDREPTITADLAARMIGALTALESLAYEAFDLHLVPRKDMSRLRHPNRLNADILMTAVRKRQFESQEELKQQIRAELASPVVESQDVFNGMNAYKR
jgi:hypothetical protein